MSADKLKTDIPDEVLESLARTILPSIRKYFDSEEGQREFMEWKEKREREKAVGQQQATKPK